jgi:hypothetical protein
MDNNTSLERIELEGYSAPIVSESKNDKWVDFGQNNDYYDYIIDIYTNSPTNNAILNSMADYIYGKGISATDSARNAGAYANLKVLFPEEEVQKMCKDLAIFSCFSYCLIPSKDRSRWAKAKHIPYNTVRAEKCNDKGEIRNFYLSYDWSNTDDNKPKSIPNYDYLGEDNFKECLVVVRPYSPGTFYYSPVDYQGGVMYAELEKLISEYYHNLVNNGFMPTTMINHHNGIPDRDKRQTIKDELQKAVTGTSGKTLLVTFNDSKDKAPEVITIPVTDAADQYILLNETSRQQIITAHRVTSPMLLGVKSDVGLGNNADEIMTAWQLYDNTKIRPKQEMMLTSFRSVLADNGLVLDTYFETLTPVEFEKEQSAIESGLDVTATPQNTEEEVAQDVINAETSYNGAQIASAIDIVESVKLGVLTEEQAKVFLKQFLKLPDEVVEQMFNSNQAPLTPTSLMAMLSKPRGGCAHHLTEAQKIDLDSIAEDLIVTGVTEDELLNEFELFDTSWADNETSEDNLEGSLNKMVALNANQASYQDGEIFKVRYMYKSTTTGSVKDDRHRPLCSKLVNAGLLYRKEDITSMSSKGGAEDKGEQYDVFLHKGGVNCQHGWERRVYRKRLKKDGEPWGGGAMNGVERSTIYAAIRGDATISQSADKKAYTAPRDTPTKGHK